MPFEIVQKQDAPQWGSAANIAVEFKDNDVLGYLGTIDGDATHVALRVSLKIETYMINTSDPDPTLTETQIPWLTRVFPDDRQQCWRLAYLVVKERGCKRIAILRESSRPGRVGVMHFNNYIRRPDTLPSLTCSTKRASAISPRSSRRSRMPIPMPSSSTANRRTSATPSPPSAQAGIQAQFFGFDRVKEEGFARNAGAAAQGMTITYFFNPERSDKAWLEFVQRYQKRWGHKPDIYAAYGYDGAKLMIQAVNQAGPNRFRVRDYLANLDEWDGVTGHMIFDARWDNIVPISLAEFKGDRWIFEPFPALKRPTAEPAKISQR